MTPGNSGQRNFVPGRPYTLGDLQNNNSSGRKSSSEGYDAQDLDFFAGGEKSGLAVQNPASSSLNARRDVINNIIDRARRNVIQSASENQSAPRSNFAGQGRVLGGDDTPSAIIPATGESSRPKRVERCMHIWRNGFSIDDGPLHSYDDPTNAELLEMINAGQAPLSILNVAQDEEVNLEVELRKEEDYKPSKPRTNFGGTGYRLGG